ncbi:MAG: histidinol dehydrogenase, partial [Streptosporangiaceae bacterium]
MLRRIDLRGQAPGRMPAADLAALLPRAELDVNAAVEQVRPLCEAVRERGAEAVREATARFDNVDLASTIVPPEALADALAGLDDELRAALTEA